MELRDYLQTARRRWVLIIGTAVGVVAIAVLFTILATPQYSSTSRVFISTTPTDVSQAYQGGLFAAQRASSYAELVNGEELSKRVADQLGLKTSAAELSTHIHASVVPETVVLRIEVRESSRKAALRLNEAVVQQLQQFVRTLETPAGKKVGLVKATVVGTPDVSDSPVSPNRRVVLAAALVLGLLIGFGVAVLRELLEVPRRRGTRAAEPASAA